MHCGSNIERDVAQNKRKIFQFLYNISINLRKALYKVQVRFQSYLLQKICHFHFMWVLNFQSDYLMYRNIIIIQSTIISSILSGSSIIAMHTAFFSPHFSQTFQAWSDIKSKHKKKCKISISIDQQLKMKKKFPGPGPETHKFACRQNTDTHTNGLDNEQYTSILTYYVLMIKGNDCSLQGISKLYFYRLWHILVVGIGPPVQHNG